MDNALLMCRVERLGELSHDAKSFIKRKWALGRLSFDQLHDKEIWPDVVKRQMATVEPMASSVNSGEHLPGLRATPRSNTSCAGIE
jgi:hypothetical protein